MFLSLLSIYTTLFLPTHVCHVYIDFSTKYGSEKSSKQLVIIVGGVIAVLLIVAFVFFNFTSKSTIKN